MVLKTAREKNVNYDNNNNKYNNGAGKQTSRSHVTLWIHE